MHLFLVRRRSRLAISVEGEQAQRFGGDPDARALPRVAVRREAVGGDAHTGRGDHELTYPIEDEARRGAVDVRRLLALEGGGVGRQGLRVVVDLTADLERIEATAEHLQRPEAQERPSETSREVLAARHEDTARCGGRDTERPEEEAGGPLRPVIREEIVPYGSAADRRIVCRC